MSPIQTAKKSNYRWTICSILFIATMINYMDRQALSLTWNDFISAEFAWTDEDYGRITSLFSLVYAIAMFFAGSLMDKVGMKKGYAIAMAIWSFGAILHAFCGIVTCGLLTEVWVSTFDEAKEVMHDYAIVGLPITTMTVTLFMACRCILAIGQAGNFPAAVTVTAEYFPRKDRAYAISIFNNGASVGALFAPLIIPLLARNYGWEMAFFITGSIGYIWILIWLIVYKKPEINEYVNTAEYAYITQDDNHNEIKANRNETNTDEQKEGKRIGMWKSFKHHETWALISGKLMTDGAWWFFLFWTPVYISDFYGYTADSAMGMTLIVVLYLISMLSIAGAYLPTFFINKHALSPTESRSRSMLIFAAIQLIGILAIPLGEISPWFFVIIIGIQAASHQSWSANLFSMVGDFFPKNSIATITGIIGAAGGISSFLIMQYSGKLFTYADKLGMEFSFIEYKGKQAAYMIVFCVLAVMYIAGWSIMKIIISNSKNRKKTI